MPAIDINRGTTNIINDPQISAEIWAKAIEDSFFMTHARQVTIPGPGMKIQTITGEPVADWVTETGAKPVSTSTFGAKTVIPYKLAVIEPFSAEFMRDKRALYDELVRRLPAALAKKFDETIMGTTAPGTGFDVLGGASTVSLSGGTSVYGQLLAADASIAAGDGIMNVIGLAPAAKSVVQGAVDNNGYPIFTNLATGGIGNILGAEVDVKKALAVSPAIGIAGDFDDAVWGMVEGIQIAFSDTATLTNGSETINLWQQNMVAVRAECEIAFAVKDVAEYVVLTA